jgi:hypothetical protein
MFRHVLLAALFATLASFGHHQAPPHPRGVCIAIKVVHGHVVCTKRAVPVCTNGVCVG